MTASTEKSSLLSQSSFLLQTYLVSKEFLLQHFEIIYFFCTTVFITGQKPYLCNVFGSCNTALYDLCLTHISFPFLFLNFTSYILSKTICIFRTNRINCPGLSTRNGYFSLSFDSSSQITSEYLKWSLLHFYLFSKNDILMNLKSR